MPTVKLTLEEVRWKPFKFTPEERARFEAMTDEEIVRAAESDPDNPPWTDEQLNRGVANRSVRLARKRLNLTQAQFAARFRIGLARLRDMEQGRYQPDSAMLAYLKVIETDSDAVDRALGNTPERRSA